MLNSRLIFCRHANGSFARQSCFTHSCKLYYSLIVRIFYVITYMYDNGIKRDVILIYLEFHFRFILMFTSYTQWFHNFIMFETKCMWMFISPLTKTTMWCVYINENLSIRHLYPPSSHLRGRWKGTGEQKRF